MSDTVKIIPATFKEIHPSSGNRYTKHSIIKKYLEETTLDPPASSIKLQKYFCGSSVLIFEIKESKTWFWLGTIICFDAAQVENFFRSEEITLC